MSENKGSYFSALKVPSTQAYSCKYYLYLFVKYLLEMGVGVKIYSVKAPLSFIKKKNKSALGIYVGKAHLEYR